MVKVGDKIRIIFMDHEPDYAGRVGTVEHIDDAGQIHGTWGGCAIIPKVDEYEVINDIPAVEEDEYDGDDDLEWWQK